MANNKEKKKLLVIVVVVKWAYHPITLPATYAISRFSINTLYI